jgi:hypothetical protein
MASVNRIPEVSLQKRMDSAVDVFYHYYYYSSSKRDVLSHGMEQIKEINHG